MRLWDAGDQSRSSSCRSLSCHRPGAATMIPLHRSGCGGKGRLFALRQAGPHGFSLVELLIAMSICVVISAGIAAVVPPARIAFERTPSELDLQQRGRTAVDTVAQAIRAAGSNVIVSEELGPLAGVVPAVIPFDLDASGKRFLRLMVFAPRPHAQGILAQHQAGSHGDRVLSPTRCPD